MNGNAEIRLDLLLFSVGGIHFGIDAEQAAKITPFHTETSGELHWFHEEMGYGYSPVPYRCPTVVTIRMEGECWYRVVIDDLEDIAELTRKDLHPLPELLEPFALRRGIWGVLPRNGRLILLVDFYRLLHYRTEHLI